MSAADWLSRSVSLLSKDKEKNKEKIRYTHSRHQSLDIRQYGAAVSRSFFPHDLAGTQQDLAFPVGQAAHA